MTTRSCPFGPTSTWLLALAALAALVIAGCGDKRKADKATESQASPQGAGEESGEGASGRVSGERDSRTQYDFAKAIKRAETTHPDDADLEWNAIRRDYHGKRYTWTVFYIPALCPAPTRCHVMPFDKTGADKAIVQGWMPRLELSPEAFSALKSACPGQKRCQFRFEGTLHHLTLSEDHLTALRFNDVKILPANTE